LFNDVVYDISKLKYLHPGGQKVIDLMRNREVNRFMYGFYKIEDDSKAPMHNHSKESMRLCGEPIAKI
jgi:cytochrome b involved in lipid metabolism